MRLVVAGFGNETAGDDSVGVEVVRRLRAQGTCNCRLKASFQPGTELLDIFDDSDVILIVDAVASGATAGSLHLLSLPSDKVKARSLEAVSGHGWGLLEVLNLARALGRRLPKIILLGIELESAVPGTLRSAAVNQAIDKVVEHFPGLESWLKNLPAGEYPLSELFLPTDEAFPGSRLVEREASMPAGITAAPAA